MKVDLAREETDASCRKCGADLYDELLRVTEHCVDVGVKPAAVGVRCLKCEQTMTFGLTWERVLTWAKPVR